MPTLGSAKRVLRPGCKLPGASERRREGDNQLTSNRRVNDDYTYINAEAQQSADDVNQLSVLQFWKRGLANRKAHKDVFVYGDYKLLDETHETVFAYKRSSEEEAFVIILNFSGKSVEFNIPEPAGVVNWVAGNYESGAPDKEVQGTISLKPWEAILGTAKV